MENRSEISKKFIPYELALKLKELGFDEECLGIYSNKNFLLVKHGKVEKNSYIEETWDMMYMTNCKNTEQLYETSCTAPLWQQAFDWLLPKLPDYNLDQMENTFDLRYYDGKEWSYIIMMGTRQACLEKLIEMVENENN